MLRQEITALAPCQGGEVCGAEGEGVDVKSKVWSVIVTGAAMVAAWVAREAAAKLWSRFADTEAPVNPADRSSSWGAATGWAVVAGVAAGVARVLGRRGAASAWEQVTGETAPGLEAA